MFIGDKMLCINSMVHGVGRVAHILATASIGDSQSRLPVREGEPPKHVFRGGAAKLSESTALRNVYYGELKLAVFPQVLLDFSCSPIMPLLRLAWEETGQCFDNFLYSWRRFAHSPPHR